MPPTAFKHALLRLERAKEHIADFKALKRPDPGQTKTLFTEKAPEGNVYVHKILFMDPSADRAMNIAADAFDNLRSALDLATSACAKAAGASNSDIKKGKVAFPFGRDVIDWKNRANNCCKLVPKEIVAYFEAIQPHYDGDKLLYGLSEIRNSNEHREMIPPTAQVHGIQVTPMPLPSESAAIPFTSTDIGDPFEVTLFTSKDPTPQFAVEVLRSGNHYFMRPEFTGQSAPQVLDSLAEKVETILTCISEIMTKTGYPW